MLMDVFRRISALVVAVSLVLGPAMPLVHASGMKAGMAATAEAGIHAPDRCDDCGGGTKAGMPVASCSVNCTGAIALPVGIAALEPAPARTGGYTASADMIGHAARPDPRPPRLHA